MHGGGMNELAIFAGAGGGILGGKLLGWRTVCAVERDAYAAQVLAQRQNDGMLQPFPIWSDVCSFDGKPWRGIVDVVSGGFPCQDISAAGRGDGINGKKSSAWTQVIRICGEIRPKFVYLENSPMLTHRGLGDVLAGLAKVGFNAKWGVLGASAIGACHKRERIWILAYSNKRAERLLLHYGNGLEMARESQTNIIKFGGCESGVHGRPAHSWWEFEPGVCRVVNGLAHRMDRLKSIGNGQVPAVAARAWNMLMSGHK